jgi:hypothetical protein
VKINGFDPIVWKKLGAIEPGEAVKTLLDFERRRFVDRRIVRVAYNSKFDAAFIDHCCESAVSPSINRISRPTGWMCRRWPG